MSPSEWMALILILLSLTGDPYYMKYGHLLGRRAQVYQNYKTSPKGAFHLKSHLYKIKHRLVLVLPIITDSAVLQVFRNFHLRRTLQPEQNVCYLIYKAMFLVSRLLIWGFLVVF